MPGYLEPSCASISFANNGAAGRSNAAGANLRAHGSFSVSAGTVVLSGAGSPCGALFSTTNALEITWIDQVQPASDSISY